MVNLNRNQQKAVEITRQEPIKKLISDNGTVLTLQLNFLLGKRKFFWPLVKSKNVLQACHEKVESI